MGRRATQARCGSYGVDHPRWRGNRYRERRGVEAVSAVKRRRGATESLLSIVLGLEAVLIFFVTLTVFALKLLPAGVAFGGGAVFAILLLLTSGMLRHEWALWVGWALQVALILLGFVHPALFVTGVIFVAIWTYCFVVGRRLDRRNAAFFTPTTN
ncbi:DUF4233 domain-containing protein [Salinibacterium hongtaonis]|uniref:DUF4233 domain-containing protein n=1 Tax=Homoserinimonas hongtaonis TaxID=2079791 RepID=A0A2U1SZ69_9MICO|nr:DUF4233 domain-containing protein [Salinibacterium hongtaonis]